MPEITLRAPESEGGGEYVVGSAAEAARLRVLGYTDVPAADPAAPAPALPGVAVPPPDPTAGLAAPLASPAPVDSPERPGDPAARPGRPGRPIA